MKGQNANGSTSTSKFEAFSLTWEGKKLTINLSQPKRGRHQRPKQQINHSQWQVDF
jgi:hypothetical protein